MNRILLVSSDPSLREDIREALAGESYALRCAPPLRRGITMLAEEPTDLIITDWTTAAKDEVESLKRLRIEHRDVKRLAITKCGTPDAVLLLSSTPPFGKRRACAPGVLASC